MAENYLDLDKNSSSLDQPMPWDDSIALPKMDDHTHDLAVRGYVKGVKSGIVDPADGIQRLAKIGVPHHKISAAVQAAGPVAQNPNMMGLPPELAPFMNALQPQIMNLKSSGQTTSDKNVSQNSNKQEQKDTQSQSNKNVSTDNSQDTSQDTTKHFASSKRFNPDEAKLILDAQRGINHPIKRYPDGTPKLDEQGEPIYDLSVGNPDPDHPVQQQEAALNRLQALMRMEHDNQANRPFSSLLNLTPLAKLADFENAKAGIRTNNAEGYQAPENYQQMRDKFMDYQQKLLKDRGDIQKSIYENARSISPTTNYTDMVQAMLGSKVGKAHSFTEEDLNKMEQGSSQSQGQTNTKANTQTQGQKDTVAQPGSGMRGVGALLNYGLRKDQQTANAADKVANNPIISQLQTRANQIQIDHDNLINMIKNGQPITKQVASELAQGLATALSGAKSAGYGMTNKQEYNTLEGLLAGGKQWVTGSPQDALPDEGKRFLLESFERMQDAYAKVMSQKANQLGIGKGFKNNPDAREAAQKAVNSFQPGSSTLPQAPKTRYVGGKLYMKNSEGTWDLVK